MNNLFEIFLAQIKADRKKAVVLAVLSVVMIAVYLQLAMRGGAPVEAEAEPAADPATVVSTAVLADPAANAHANRPGGTAAIPAASGGPSPFSPVDAVSIAGFSRQLLRDLFETDWDHFHPTPELASELTRRNRPADETAGGLRSFWRQVLLRAAEQQREEEVLRHKVEKQVADLKLQGVLAGANPKAYLDGRWVAVGEVIGGFRVVRITAREVELLKSGVHVRLTMP